MFLENGKSNILPEPGVLKEVIVDCVDGVVGIDAAGKAAKL